VVPVSATRRADGGAPIVDAGPAATIRSPRTKTAQPWCISVPSKTRSGSSNVAVLSRDPDVAAAGCAVAREALAAMAATAAMRSVLESVTKRVVPASRFES
jgi:hypothetical protein